MGATRQIVLLLEMSCRGMKSRLGPMLVVVVGLACVVGVLISMLSIGASFRVLGAEGTRDDRLIVTAAGNRTINRDTLLTFSNLEGVKRNDGKPLVSGVMFGFAEGRKQVDNVRVMYGVRG